MIFPYYPVFLLLFPTFSPWSRSPLVSDHFSLLVCMTCRPWPKDPVTTLKLMRASLTTEWVTDGSHVPPTISWPPNSTSSTPSSPSHHPTPRKPRRKSGPESRRNARQMSKPPSATSAGIELYYANSAATLAAAGHNRPSTRPAPSPTMPSHTATHLSFPSKTPKKLSTMPHRQRPHISLNLSPGLRSPTHPSCGGHLLAKSALISKRKPSTIRHYFAILAKPAIDPPIVRDRPLDCRLGCRGKRRMHRQGCWRWRLSPISTA